jgi:hypothetical protein
MTFVKPVDSTEEFPLQSSNAATTMNCYGGQRLACFMSSKAQATVSNAKSAI